MEFSHAMDQSYDPQRNGQSVEKFRDKCKQILKEDGEIHITLHINHQIDDEIGKRCIVMHISTVCNMGYCR